MSATADTDLGRTTLRRLQQTIGVENSVVGVSQSLHMVVTELHAPVVGAVHVTCADETEHECATAFHQAFVRYLVPALKFGQQAACRLANLGGQYEWGAMQVADEHFAAATALSDHKLMVLKINAHVAATAASDGQRFGTLARYRGHSSCCSALSLLLEGDQQPYVKRLREAFQSEGKDRIATLLDEDAVSPDLRPLWAACVSARLQARKAILDIQDHRPAARTLYLVLPCVTINRPERDTEIVCGYYWSDWRAAAPEYFGLGDDPADLELTVKNRALHVTDRTSESVRRARDHREIAKRAYANLRSGPRSDPRIDAIERDVAAGRHRDHAKAKSVLRALLPILAEVDPVSSAVYLFAHGAAGIHHTFRVHRLAKEMRGSEEARRILDEVHERVDRLAPERAEALIDLLMQEYRK